MAKGITPSAQKVIVKKKLYSYIYIKSIQLNKKFRSKVSSIKNLPGGGGGGGGGCSHLANYSITVLKCQHLDAVAPHSCMERSFYSL